MSFASIYVTGLAAVGIGTHGVVHMTLERLRALEFLLYERPSLSIKPSGPFKYRPTNYRIDL